MDASTDFASVGRPTTSEDTAAANTVPTLRDRRREASRSLFLAVTHDDTSVVGQGCDDQFEFEFALDLLLDGFQRLKKQNLM
jgi:hypothetical protein